MVIPIKIIGERYSPPTRAYFTSATCAISLFMIMGVKHPITIYSYLPLNYSPSKEFSSTSANADFDSAKCSNLVLWDSWLYHKNYEHYKSAHHNMELTKGILTREARNAIDLTHKQKSILVGMILSDAWIKKRPGWNPAVSIKQSMKHIKYVYFLLNELKSLFSSYPHITSNIKRGKRFFALTLTTRSLQAINPITNLFLESKYSNKKVIKAELFDYINYISLAHWIMGDGSKKNKGTILCTDSFSFKEIVLLMNILRIKFDLETRIFFEKGKPRIFIPQKELKKIRVQLEPFMIKEFLYKIHL